MVPRVKVPYYRYFNYPISHFYLIGKVLLEQLVEFRIAGVGSF